MHADDLRHPVLNGQPAITSTASAPPTPIATMPRPPALGVWLSVPIIIPPGNAYLLEHDLVDDPGPGLPEADAVLRRHRAEELVDLGVHVERACQVGVGADAGLDEVVAVHRARHLHRRQPGGHELQQRHLRGGVLHGDPVGPVVGVVDAPFDADRRRIVGVREEHLLGEGERATEATTGVSEARGVPCVRGLDELERRGGLDSCCHGGPIESTPVSAASTPPGPRSGAPPNAAAARTRRRPP